MNNFYSKYINIWLLSLATIILIMIAVGGLTRLTESGLSMVGWDPIMGIIPRSHKLIGIFCLLNINSFLNTKLKT